MRVLSLRAYYDPEKTAGSHMLHDLHIALEKAGIETELYVPAPSRGVDKQTRKEYAARKHEDQYGGYVHVHRFAMFPEGRNPIIRAFRYALCNLIQYCKGVGTKNIDVIYASSTPPTQGMLCSLIKKRLCKKYGHYVPFIYDLQDIFPDSLINANMTREGSLIWKIGRKIEDFTYRNADKIVVISEGFKQNIMAKGVPEEKIVIIPNWVNTDNVHPVSREDNVLFDRYNLPRDKFYICYSGNIGHSQNLELLVKTAKDLQQELPQVRFVLIGEGAEKANLEQTIREENIANMTVLPFQPYEEISHVFSLGDAGLVISKAGIGGSSVPSKTWSIMAAQRPVLASFDLDSELNRVVAQAACGITAAADDAPALKAAIRKLYNDKEMSAQMGKRGRQYLKEYLDKDKCVGKHIDTICSLQK